MYNVSFTLEGKTIIIGIIETENVARNLMLLNPLHIIMLCENTHTHIQIHTHTYRHTHSQVYTHKDTRIHTQTHMHAQARTHTHTTQSLTLLAQYMELSSKTPITLTTVNRGTNSYLIPTRNGI